MHVNSEVNCSHILQLNTIMMWEKYKGHKLMNKSPPTASIAQRFDSLSIFPVAVGSSMSRHVYWKWGNHYYLEGNLAPQPAAMAKESMFRTPGVRYQCLPTGAGRAGKRLLICNPCEVGRWPQAELRGAVNKQPDLDHVRVCLRQSGDALAKRRHWKAFPRFHRYCTFINLFKATLKPSQFIWEQSNTCLIARYDANRL